MLGARTIAVILVLMVAAGCQSKKPTQREEAKQQWNAARASVMFSLAKGQYEAGHFERSRKTVDEALLLDPKNVPLHILSAKLAIEQGELELAEKELALTREIDPRNAEVDYLSGVIFQRWQQPQRAHDFYASASEKAPAELAYVLARAEMLVLMDRSDDALRLLQQRVVYFEHSAAVRDAVGQLLMQEGRYPEAIDMLRQASILATDDLAIREHLALALYFGRQYREAVDVLSRLLRDESYEKRADLFTALGESQLQLGRPRDARTSFETAAALDPLSPQIALSLGKAAVQLNDLRRAEISLRRATALDPYNSEAHLMMGYLRLRQSQLPEALASFRRAHQLDPGDTVSLCMLGYVLERMGEHEQAMAHYGRALQLRPHDDLATRLMAGAME
jgi:Flp pilus assembly protein TadD